MSVREMNDCSRSNRDRRLDPRRNTGVALSCDIMADPLESLASQKSSLDVRSALALLRKRKWLLLAIVVAVPAVAGYMTSKKPKIYEAVTSIVIEQSVPQYLGAGFRDVVEIETNWWSSKENLTTDFRILASESQAIATARALCDRKMGPDQQTGSDLLAAGRDVQRSVGILQGGASDPGSVAGRAGEGLADSPSHHPLHESGVCRDPCQHHGGRLPGEESRAASLAVSHGIDLARRAAWRPRASVAPGGAGAGRLQEEVQHRGCHAGRRSKRALHQAQDYHRATQRNRGKAHHRPGTTRDVHVDPVVGSGH